jgi:hypothetical protein
VKEIVKLKTTTVTKTLKSSLEIGGRHEALF